jgi:hypothetical protein
VGKGYESRGLFRLSLNDACVNSVNHVSQDNETNVWHSRLCHINFSCMTRLAGLNLIPKINLVKGSKCYVCVESKQSRKPHKAAAARDLAPLELIHFDLCEMNGELTKGGKGYFMTFIDDCTIFCHVYLLKSKDEAVDTKIWFERKGPRGRNLSKESRNIQRGRLTKVAINQVR